MLKFKSKRPRQRASDEEIWRAYKHEGSVWLAAKRLGMCGQSVHERLVKIGAKLKFPKWTKADEYILIAEYESHASAGKLEDLARRLKRTKHFICRKARGLGLTNASRAKVYMRVWKGMPEGKARQFFDKFKKSRLGLGAYCKKNGFDDLGFSREMKLHFPDEWEHVIEAKCPKQTMYRRGRQVEYAVRDHLKSNGYPVVLRSPRSGGPADLVAIKKCSTLLIQVKRNMCLGVKEWNTIYQLAESVGGHAILAGRPTGIGLVYKRLIGPKDGSKRRQPMVDFNP